MVFFCYCRNVRLMTSLCVGQKTNTSRTGSSSLFRLMNELIKKHLVVTIINLLYHIQVKLPNRFLITVILGLFGRLGLD